MILSRVRAMSDHGTSENRTCNSFGIRLAASPITVMHRSTAFCRIRSLKKTSGATSPANVIASRIFSKISHTKCRQVRFKVVLPLLPPGSEVLKLDEGLIVSPHLLSCLIGVPNHQLSVENRTPVAWVVPSRNLTGYPHRCPLALLREQPSRTVRYK